MKTLTKNAKNLNCTWLAEFNNANLEALFDEAIDATGTCILEVSDLKAMEAEAKKRTAKNFPNGIIGVDGRNNDGSRWTVLCTTSCTRTHFLRVVKGLIADGKDVAYYSDIKMR